MTDETSDDRLRARIQRQGEDAIGKVAQELLENSLVSGAIQRAFEARELASQAQEAAMGALNIPSASDLERLTRRIRSVSQRLEGIEDGLDRVDERIARLGSSTAIEQRLAGIEGRLEVVGRELAGLRTAFPDPTDPVHREQERLAVDEEDEPAASPAPATPRSPGKRQRAARKDPGG